MSDSTSAEEKRLDASAGMILVGAIFVLAVCGLVYELAAGALSSYLLGNSVTQFSLVIGIFLTSMGGGSWLSKFIERRLLERLITVEAAVGVIGGFMAPVGFAAFAFTEVYEPVLLGFVVVIGVLVGLEIPLVIRILKQRSSLRVTLSNVLTADYAGALAASLIFPFLLLPHLGVVRASLVTGLVNVVVAAFLLFRFAPYLEKRAGVLKIFICALAGIMIGALIGAGEMVSFFEARLYADEIIYTKETPYQRMVLTRRGEDVRLFLDGRLQFSSVDEYRYHEALVHIPMYCALHREKVLILGGGDGLAAEEVLKHGEVKQIDLVDIDRNVTDFFRKNSLACSLNNDALSNPKVKIYNQDAMKFLEQCDTLYDVILIDLPDPSVPELGKLYSRPFYNLVKACLAEEGVMSCQSTSPFRSREAFWCIVHTIEAAGLQTRPYQTYIPTFGSWGFTLASRWQTDIGRVVPEVETRFVNESIVPSLFVFPPDISEVETPVSGLDKPVVCRLYTSGYHKYLE